MRLISTVLIAVVSFSLHATADSELQETQNRIKPVGQVRIQKAPQVASPGKKNPGQGIYDQHCVVCHRDGIAGAPRVQEEKDWKPRLTGRTIDDLLVSSIKGLNAMPAKGTCSECTEADLKDAIQYMLPKS